MTGISMKRLEGKSALITGSARGIGRAFAEAYVREGARVAIADINIERARQTAGEIGAAAYAVQMDVTSQQSIDDAVGACVAEAGGIDILVNNAALFDLAPIVEISRDSYDRLFSINVAGTLFTMQAVAKQMIAQGRGGKIINMASQAGRRGEALVAVYCATKAAVRFYGDALRVKLRRQGIVVSVICPGFVTTPMTERNPFPMPLLMPAEQAASRILRGLARRRAMVAFPRRLYLASRLMAMLPRAITDRLLARVPSKE